MNYVSDSLYRARKAARQPGGRGFWRPILLVLFLEALAVLAFYGFEWSWLRRLHVLWLQDVLQSLGCALQAGLYSLTVNGREFQISRDCTYVDLIICGLPLLWRGRQHWVGNLTVLAAYAGAVVLVNLIRVLYGVYAYANGVSLFLAHDFLDYLLWYPTMAILVFLWVRSLRTLWFEPLSTSNQLRRLIPLSLSKCQKGSLTRIGSYTKEVAGR